VETQADGTMERNADRAGADCPGNRQAQILRAMRRGTERRREVLRGGREKKKKKTHPHKQTNW